MLASKIRASSVAVSLSFCASKSSCCRSKVSHLFFNSNLFFACCNRNLETAFLTFAPTISTLKRELQRCLLFVFEAL